MFTITGTNVTIMVNDMDKAIQFYESIGLSLQQRWGNHYAMITAPGITIGLHPSEDLATNSGTVSIGFMISSVDEVKEVLGKNNIDFTDSDDGKSGIYIHFKDPYGTALYFVKPAWN